MGIGVQVVIDCADPRRLAAFWAEALGYVLQPPPEGFASWEEFLRGRGVPEHEWGWAAAIVDPDGLGPRVFFQRVPEPRSGKNRLHLDVNAGGPHGASADERRRRVDAHVTHLVYRGADVLREVQERGERWIVMRDPEGNEFCVQ